MNGKDFERYLELISLREKHYAKKLSGDFEHSEELYHLQTELENVLFDNQSNFEKIICKLKNALASWRYSISISSKPNESLNEIKIIREIMSLLDTYDWKVKYKEYITSADGKVTIWEENGEGQKRNAKTWNILKEMCDITGNNGREIGQSFKNIGKNI